MARRFDHRVSEPRPPGASMDAPSTPDYLQIICAEYVSEVIDKFSCATIISLALQRWPLMVNRPSPWPLRTRRIIAQRHIMRKEKLLRDDAASPA